MQQASLHSGGGECVGRAFPLHADCAGVGSGESAVRYERYGVSVFVRLSASQGLTHGSRVITFTNKPEEVN